MQQNKESQNERIENEDTKKDFTVNPVTLIIDVKDALGMFWAAFKRQIPVPWHSVIWTALFLLYFILPIDLMPEAFLSVFGFGDDLLAFVWVINKIRPDIDNYRAYRDSLKSGN